jgi:hypothetical protein
MSSPVGGSFGGAEIRIGDVHSGSTEDVSASTVPQGLKVPPTEKTVRKQLSLGGLFKGIGKFLLGAAAFTGVLLLTGSNPIGLACLGAIAFCTTIAWLGRVKQSGGSGNSSAEQMSNKMSSAGQSANVAESLTGSGDAGAAEREKAEANKLKVKLTRQSRAQEVELALGGRKQVPLLPVTRPVVNAGGQVSLTAGQSPPPGPIVVSPDALLTAAKGIVPGFKLTREQSAAISSFLSKFLSKSVNRRLSPEALIDKFDAHIQEHLEIKMMGHQNRTNLKQAIRNVLGLTSKPIPEEVLAPVIGRRPLPARTTLAHGRQVPGGRVDHNLPPVVEVSVLVAANYEGFHTDYEGVKNLLESTNDGSYVSICNPSLVQFEQGDGNESVADWKIHMSFDPTKLTKAWEIFHDEIQRTDLPIKGKIHSSTTGSGSNAAQPGKQIAIMLEKTSEGSKLEVFLSRLSHRFQEAGIGTDSRPINSDPEQASRKWDTSIPVADGMPSYFNFRTDSYTVVEDELFDELVEAGTAGPLEGNINLAKNIAGGADFVRKSHFPTIPDEKKCNPLGIECPFDGMVLT